MWQQSEHEGVDDFYLAGEKVLPGVYRQIGGSREVHFEKEDVLPASLDGRVACYVRVHHLWSEWSEMRKLSA